MCCQLFVDHCRRCRLKIDRYYACTLSIVVDIVDITGCRGCDIECLVQTWLSRKSAPTGAPLLEHDVGVG